MDTRVESKMCSFCGQTGSRSNRLAGGLGAMICMECLDFYHRDSQDLADRDDEVGNPLGGLSDTEMLEKLPLILRSAAQNADFATDWVVMLRERKISWAEIGKVLGVTRQAAWERFAASVAHRSADSAR